MEVPKGTDGQGNTMVVYHGLVSYRDVVNVRMQVSCESEVHHVEIDAKDENQYAKGNNRDHSNRMSVKDTHHERDAVRQELQERGSEVSVRHRQVQGDRGKSKNGKKEEMKGEEGSWGEGKEKEKRE